MSLVITINLEVFLFQMTSTSNFVLRYILINAGDEIMLFFIYLISTDDFLYCYERKSNLVLGEFSLGRIIPAIILKALF